MPSLIKKFESFTGKFESPQLAILRSISLFSQIATGELRTIRGLLHQRTYIKGEIVFDEGEETQAVYFILKGKVVIRRQGTPTDSMIAELGVGQCFGEMALLDDSPRMAQSLCAGRAVQRRLPHPVQTHSQIASILSLELARMMGDRLRRQIASGYML